LKEIAESLQVQHPIIYDVYDLCDMNNRNKLQVFDVSMMKTICIRILKYRLKKFN
jgi:hypothetical protein